MNFREQQRRLLLWRDYLKLLKAGMMHSDRGSQGRPWSGEETVALTGLDVAISELESDILHLERGEPKLCQWDRVPKDLSEYSLNNEP